MWNLITNPFPKRLVVDVKQPLRLLDKLAGNQALPTLDLDAILSSLVELLERPNLTGRKLQDAVQWLLEANGLNDTEIEIEDADEAKACFYTCLILMRQDLQTINPYTNSQLCYRFKERHNGHAIILERLPAPQG